MKRIEMIDEIMCVLLSHSVKYPQYPLVNLKEAAEQILQMQENIGMLPPFNKSYMDSSNGESTVDIKNYKWESEE